MRGLILLILLSLGQFAKAVQPVVTDSSRYTGFVVALAWPKAWAKEAGDGYDKLLRGLGFNDGGFYRVGHAALVLVNGADGSCHYFDFGRYHTPTGMGRVRDVDADHELAISTKAIAEEKRILNLDQILCEVQSNPNTHASGPLYASYVRINFDEAHAAAKALQSKQILPYGPFEKEGLNCSRFVREIILAGDPNWAHALRLKVVPMITPTVLYPVSALYHWTKVPGCLDEEAEETKEQLSALPDSLFHQVLPVPECPANVSIDAQWLAGESSGSWFELEPVHDGYRMTRYSATGIQECSGILTQTNGPTWNVFDSFEITYPSNCSKVTLLVNGQTVELSPT